MMKEAAQKSMLGMKNMHDSLLGQMRKLGGMLGPLDKLKDLELPLPTVGPIEMPTFPPFPTPGPVVNNSVQSPEIIIVDKGRYNFFGRLSLQVSTKWPASVFGNGGLSRAVGRTLSRFFGSKGNIAFEISVVHAPKNGGPMWGATGRGNQTNTTPARNASNNSTPYWKQYKQPIAKPPPTPNASAAGNSTVVSAAASTTAETMNLDLSASSSSSSFFQFSSSVAAQAEAVLQRERQRDRHLMEVLAELLTSMERRRLAATKKSRRDEDHEDADAGGSRSDHAEDEESALMIRSDALEDGAALRSDDGAALATQGRGGHARRPTRDHRRDHAGRRHARTTAQVSSKKIKEVGLEDAESEVAGNAGYKGYVPGKVIKHSAVGVGTGESSNDTTADSSSANDTTNTTGIFIFVVQHFFQAGGRRGRSIFGHAFASTVFCVFPLDFHHVY